MRVKLINYVLCGILFKVVLSGCTKIEDVRRVTPHGNNFQKALVTYYLKFAEKEAAQYDWLDSQHFTNKAMKLAYGKNVLPEDPKKWNIPSDILLQMQQARDSLISLLKNKNLIEKYPEIVAKTQFYFDCWVEEQEENWQAEDIKLCCNNFYKYFNELSNNKPTKIKCIKPNCSNAQKQLNIVKQTHNFENFIYSLKFLPKDNKVTNVMDHQIQKIISNSKKNNKRIIINSYSNKLSNEKANIILAQSRAENVKQKLKASGIAGDRIEMYAFVEDKPMISNPTNMLEIIISD
ncbi:OmpA family protein [Rickettsiales bacterium Ac37b]|nr:OmpA family protein [Rickettsiales bacterium Ac37b]